MNKNDTDRIWDLMHSMRVCMLTSWNGKKQLARPMTSRAHKDRHAIYFLDKADSEKENEIKQYPAVALAYGDTGANTYLAIAGHAAVSNDRAIIRELWTDFDKAYFDSPDDPQIRLITVTPESAELWDGPNKLLAGAKMLFAAATGNKPDMGENKRMAI